jgi:hypothetical protein
MAVYGSNSQWACQPPVELSCGHIFGKPCIEAWFDKNKKHELCPTCRQNVKKGRPAGLKARLAKGTHLTPQWLRTIVGEYYNMERRVIPIPGSDSPKRITPRYPEASEKANATHKRFIHAELQVRATSVAIREAQKEKHKAYRRTASDVWIRHLCQKHPFFNS